MGTTVGTGPRRALRSALNPAKSPGGAVTPRGQDTNGAPAVPAPQDSRRPDHSLIIRGHRDRAFYEAKFRYQGAPVKRRIGPAWLERDPAGGWRPRRGRVPDGFYDERRAHIRAAEIVDQAVAELRANTSRRAATEPRPLTFRALAAEYLVWLETVRGARPSTLRQHRSDLAEPDRPYARGRGRTLGHVMRHLGDMPAGEITTGDVERLLAAVAATGSGPRTVNRVRSVVSAVLSYGARAHGLKANPAAAADRRREPPPALLVHYTVEEVEAVARALRGGLHRDPRRPRVDPQDVLADAQDGEAVRIAAYTGMRMGELLALQWRDIDFAASTITVCRALSAGTVGPPKSGRYRTVPLADQAAAALERLSRREDFTSPGDLVLCNTIGRALDPSALRRRFKRARDRSGLRPLRWHDLRHTFGSLLVAGGVDLVAVKDALGHSDLKTTSRYLHARPAHERAAQFTTVFASDTDARQADVFQRERS